MISVTLGVAIGVVFVFLLFSLFLSAALEAIAGLFKLRGRALRVAIARLIDDPTHAPKWGGFGLIDKIAGTSNPRATRADIEPPGPDAVDAVDADRPEAYEAATESPEGEYVAPRPLRFAAVFHHPLVAGSQSSGKPSYVSAQNFASALLHGLRADGVADLAEGVRRGVAALPPGPVRTALETAVEEAGGDWGKLKAGVERWYDHAMDRLSGEYKRFSQLATFLVGLALAGIYNVDAIAIAQRLYVDDQLRAAIGEQATQYVRNATAAVPSEPASTTAAASAPGNALLVPVATAVSASALSDFEKKLGAAKEARETLTKTISFVDSRGDRSIWKHISDQPSVLFGWLATALAGMLGAPFWFELLQKLVNLRGTGPKPPAVTPKTGETR